MSSDEYPRGGAASPRNERPATESGTVAVPREVLEFFEFCDMSFVPFTGQQEQLMISLRKARVAMGRREYRFGERRPPIAEDSAK